MAVEFITRIFWPQCSRMAKQMSYVCKTLYSEDFFTCLNLTMGFFDIEKFQCTGYTSQQHRVLITVY